MPLGNMEKIESNGRDNLHVREEFVSAVTVDDELKSSPSVHNAVAIGNQVENAEISAASVEHESLDSNTRSDAVATGNDDSEEVWAAQAAGIPWDDDHQVPQSVIVCDEKCGNLDGPESFVYTRHAPDAPNLMMNMKFIKFLAEISRAQELSRDNQERLRLIIQGYETDEEVETEAGFLSRVNVIDNVLRQHISTQLIDMGSFTLDLFHFVYRVVYTKDPSEIPNALRSLMRIHGVAAIESTLFSMLSRPFIDFRKHKGVYTEASPLKSDPDHVASETVDQLGDLMEYVFDSAFADAVKNVLIAVATLKMTDYHTCARIFEILGKRPNGSLFEVTKGAIKSLAIIVRALEDIAIGKDDLHTILFAKDKWIMALQTFATLSFRRERLRTGVARENDGLFDRVEWLKQAEELRTYFSGKLHRTSQAKSIYTQIASMICNLDEWIAIVRAAHGANYKPTPIGFCIHGPPKIGKSSLIDLHASLYSSVIGRKFKPEHIYHRNMASTYFDGFCAQPYIHYSEVGSAAKKIAEGRDDPITGEITSVMDSQPMVLNMAGVDDKGKKWNEFELVLVDTNNKLMNFDKNKMNAGAYLRRFFFVKAVVRWEVTSDGVTLDQRLAQQETLNGRHPMDLWKFTLECVDVQGNDSYTFVPVTYKDRDGNDALIQLLDIFEYSYAVKQVISKHVRSQEAILDMRRTGIMFDAENYKSAADYASFKSKTERNHPGLREYEEHFVDKDFASVDGSVDSKDEKESRLSQCHAKDSHTATHSDTLPSSNSEDRRNVMDMDLGSFVKFMTDKQRDCHNQVHATLRKFDKPEVEDEGFPDNFSERSHIPIDEEESPVIKQNLKPLISTLHSKDNDKCETLYRHWPSLDEVCEIVQNRSDDDKDDVKTEAGIPDLLKGPDTKSSRFASMPRRATASLASNTLRSFLENAVAANEVFIVEIDATKYSFKFDKGLGCHTYAYFTGCAQDFLTPVQRRDIEACVKSNIEGVSGVIWGELDLRTIKKSDQLESIHIDRGTLSIYPLRFSNNAFHYLRKSKASGKWKEIKNCVSYAGSAVGSTVVMCWDYLFGREELAQSIALYSFVCSMFLMSFGFIPFSITTILSGCSCYFKNSYSKKGVKLALWARSKWRDVYDYLDLKWHNNPFENFVFGTHISLLLSTFAALVTLPFVVSYWTSTKKKTADTETGEIENMESQLGCGPSLKRRSKAAIVNDFGLWDDKPSKSKCTGLPKELAVKATRNVRAMVVTDERKEPRVGYITGIKGDAAITAGHYFWGEGPFTVKIYTTAGGVAEGAFVEKTFSASEFVPVGEDVVVFRYPSLSFHDILEHVGEGKFSETGEIFVNGTTSNGRIGKETVETTDKHTGKVLSMTKYLVYPKGETKSGSCGLPVIYQKDKGSALCGVHTSGSSKEGFASLINKDELVKFMDHKKWIMTEARSSTLHVQTISNIIDEETTLDEVSVKSPFHYNVFENIEYRGRWPSTRVNINQKSCLVESELSKRADFVDTMYHIFGEFQHAAFSRPMMKPKTVHGEYICPYTIALKKANKQKKFLDTRTLERVVVKLSDHFVSNLRARGIDTLNPIRSEFAINGDLDDDFLRRITASTSSGFGFAGKKSVHLELKDETHRVMSDELEELLVNILAAVKRGERMNFVYSVSLKDEPRLLEKCLAGKTRLFYMSPLPLLILQRMFLSPFYTLMVQMSDIFCVALGANMHSDGHTLYERLCAFSDKWMEGDYGGFDLQMPFEIGQAAASIVTRVLRQMGYSESAMDVVNMILDSGLFPTVHMNGDIFCIPALQPSGKYATAEDNSLRGLIMLYYFWETSECRDKNFFDFVLPLLYGDDVLVAVKPEVQRVFNNVTYAKFVEKHYGMEYTSAVKAAIDVEFQDPDKASFLKRRWKDHASLPHKVAALDLDSIYRMLTWLIPSNYEPISAQTLATYDSALREAFFHLDEFHYTMFRAYLTDDYISRWPEYVDVCYSRLPVYESLVQKFAETESGKLNKDLLKTLQKELDDLKIDDNEFGGKSYSLVRQSFDYSSHAPFRRRVDEYFALSSRRDELRHTICYLKQAADQEENDKLHTQSAPLMDVGEVKESTVSVRENIVDVGGLPENTSDLGSAIDLTRPTHLQPSDFISRPIKIAQAVIPLTTFFGQQFNIWSLLSLDPSVRSKLRNYSLMRADLEITIEVAASPFHYGRLLIAYFPKISSNEITEAMVNSTSTYQFQRLQYMSQQIGARIMDFRENKPLVLHVPYVNYQPFCRLYVPGSATALGTGTAIPDLSNMGVLYIATLDQLQAANSTAPTSALLYLYARFVNVTLAGPTASQTAITTESGEMKEGPVEKASSAMVAVSGALEKVPVIAPWAQASSMIFKGVGSMASLFGWSAPRVDPSIAPPEYMYNLPLSSNAVTVTRSTALKLAFDPLQATGVDPRITGVEDDELSLSSISSRMSLLDQFAWSPTSVPMTTVLWSCAIMPNANKVGPINTTTSLAFVQPTALSFASQMFDFWCGDIEYTFDFVVSSLHRGKVLIQIDPNIAQYSLITANFELNKDYSLIVDLQEVQRVAVCVKWLQPRMWLRTAPMQLANRSVSATMTPVPLQGYANGFIVVTPFTTLQSPDGSSVSVNVFIRSTNIRYNQLDNVQAPTIRAFTQSGYFPEDVTCEELGEPVMDIGIKASLNFGEQPLSFRSYLKRYMDDYSSTYAVTAMNEYFLRPPVYPDIQANYNGSSTRPSVLSYLRYAYLGMIGGIRKRVAVYGANFSSMDRTHVSLNEPNSTDTTSLVIATAADPALGDAKGYLAFVPSTQGGVEVELPMYTNNYFLPSGLADTALVKGVADTNFDPYYSESYNWYFWNSSATSVKMTIESSVAEDFTLMRWMGAPFFATSQY